METKSDDEWWRPENLIKSQEQVRKINDFSNLNPKSDFGSYRRVLLGDDFSSSMLTSHNDLSPETKIKFIHGLYDLGQESALDILDVGCGMGFTSECLGRYYNNANVLGIEVSEDAIEYAKTNHKNAKFLCSMVRPEGPKMGNFDLIFAFEFYPFTRTSDINVHCSYLNYLIEQLNEGGRVILYQNWNNHKSISPNLNEIKTRFPLYNFKLIYFPHRKVLEICKFKPLAKITDFILCKIFNKGISKVLIISLN